MFAKDLSHDDDGIDKQHLKKDTKGEEQKQQLRILQFNTDGLSSDSALERFRGLCYDIILSLDPKPDVIFFQEIVPDTLREIRKHLEHEVKSSTSSTSEAASSSSSGSCLTQHRELANYEVITPFPKVSRSIPEYFTSILVNVNTIEVVKSELIPFPNSSMGRNLLKVEASLKSSLSKSKDDSPVMSLFCSHLESLEPEKDERMNQLEILFSNMQSTLQSGLVDFSIFGGDANLRDAEQQSARDNNMMPSYIYDAWEAAGHPSDKKFTWDMKTNDNLGKSAFQKGKEPQRRYDRVFFANANELGASISNPSSKGASSMQLKKKHSIKLTNFELVGTKRLENTPRKMFPSDHFGILCDFQIT